MAKPEGEFVALWCDDTECWHVGFVPVGKTRGHKLAEISYASEEFVVALIQLFTLGYDPDTPAEG